MVPHQNAQPASPASLGTGAFTDLINLLLGPDANEPPIEPAAERTPDFTQLDPRQADTSTSPQQIAQALIRTMMNQAPANSGAEAIPDAAGTAAPVSPDRKRLRLETAAASAPVLAQIQVSVVPQPALDPNAQVINLARGAGSGMPFNWTRAALPTRGVPGKLAGLSGRDLAFGLNLSLNNALPGNAIPARNVQEPETGAASFQFDPSAMTDASAPDAWLSRKGPEPVVAPQGIAADPQLAPPESPASNPFPAPFAPQPGGNVVSTSGASHANADSENPADDTPAPAASASEEHKPAFAKDFEIPQIKSPAAPEQPHAPQRTAAAALRSVDPISAPSAPRTPAAHDIAVRISRPDAPAVDVHLMERAGGVHVAVRTPDGGLQTSLRQDLSSLVKSLEHAGFRTEAIVPQQTTAASQPARQESEGNSWSWAEQHSGHRQQQHHRQGKRNSQSRDEIWALALENAA